MIAVFSNGCLTWCSNNSINIASVLHDSDHKLVRERSWLEINTKIGRPEDSSQTNNNVRQLWNRAIPVAPFKVHLSSGSVQST